MSSDEIRLWRDSLGSFVRDSVFGAATHIAVPAAKHAALMRVVEAARALLDLLAYEHPDFGYSEIADLRAALALPADAAGSAEAVRAACAAVPALEEARRRRLRWADEAHAQILAVPAQPAPAQAGEAVLPFAMFCYVCGEPAACIGYECGEEPGAHTLNGCCNDHCGGHGNESERCVQLAPHPSRPGGADAPAPDAALLDRVVLIDHTPEMLGRVYDKAGVSVEMQMQDNGRTLKVFVQARAVAHGGAS